MQGRQSIHLHYIYTVIHAIYFASRRKKNKGLKNKKQGNKGAAKKLWYKGEDACRYMYMLSADIHASGHIIPISVMALFLCCFVLWSQTSLKFLTFFCLTCLLFKIHVYGTKYSNNLHLNIYTEKWGGHYTLFVAILHLLHNITDVQEQPSCYRKCGWKAIMHAQIINYTPKKEVAFVLYL